MSIKLEDLGAAAQKQVIAKLLKEGKLKPKVSKMGNVKTNRGNVKFDSLKEAKRYDELMLMLKAGEIRDLRLQHDCTLQEAFTTPEGKRVRAIKYRADFTYYRKTAPDTYGYEHWVYVVEDVKGRRLPGYINKAKQFRDKYGFDITEI